MVGVLMVLNLTGILLIGGAAGGGGRGAGGTSSSSSSSSPLSSSSPPSPGEAGAVEASLLKLLGLPRRPRPADPAASGAHPRRRVPPEMIELYKRQTGLDLDTLSFQTPGRMTASANTLRTFFPTGNKTEHARVKRNDRFRLHFNLTGLPKEERVTAAELRLSLQPQEIGKPVRILVHDIVRPGVKGKTAPILRLIDSRTIGPDAPEAVLDVFPAAERWRNEPRHNHGLLVRLDSPSVSAYSSQKLMLFTDDGKNVQAKSAEELLSRSKRAVGKKHRRKDGRDNCRRHPLYVDFKDVGWDDWIVAPPGYDAYYCQGDCPFPLADHLNSTNHAIVQTLMNSLNSAKVPKACCVPTQLTSISMLYVDEDIVVLKNYQDMAVVGCGCR